jgi:hypothetical protein
MKIFFLPVLIILSSITANAGNMFGPAPFRNGSPLPTGNDGTYQATARAENVTGIFRFAFSGGSQTANPGQNNWIFFINGQIQRGTVIANLSTSSLNGIFDSASSVSSSTNSTISLPYITINQNNNSSGTFSGKLQQNSPNGAFNGDGFLEGLPDSEGEVLIIAEETTVDPETEAETTRIRANVFPYPISGGDLARTSFKFRGVRTSTSTTAALPNTTVPAN